MTPAQIEVWSRQAFHAACLAELRAPKPGNVHDFAPGHRMTVADFEASAAAAASSLACFGAPVGARVLAAMRATMAAVGTNTNLGILLLCAPLAGAAERLGGPASLEEFTDSLRRVLAETTVADAAAVFSAITAANPGGLGQVADHDVAGPALVTLTEAMAAAADRDTIARQYVTTFSDLVEIGLPAFRNARSEPQEDAARTVAVYFAFASRLPDSHICRKFGSGMAEAVRQEFEDSAILADRYDVPRLLDLDRRLKERGLNPGTSADLTVATLYLTHLLGLRTIT